MPPLHDGVRATYYPVLRLMEFSAAAGYTTPARLDPPHRCEGGTQGRKRTLGRPQTCEWANRYALSLGGGHLGAAYWRGARGGVPRGERGDAARHCQRVESDGTDLSLSCADRHAEFVPLTLPQNIAAAPC